MELCSILAVLISVCFYLNGVASVQLRAYVSQHGLHGEFHFVQRDDNSVEIKSYLETTLQYPDQIWSWGIHKMPVDYREIDGYRRCHLSKIGSKVIDFDSHLGYLEMPGNESVEWTLSSEIIRGQSIWGKSLVLQNPNDDFRVCGTITAREDDINHLAEARFRAPITGSIYFHWLSAKDTSHQNMLINSNLFYTQNIATSNRLTKHPWKIFVTDIFENDPDKTQTDCNILQLIYDPQNAGFGQSIGDIDSRVGEIEIAGYNQGSLGSNQLFEDDKLILLPSDLSGPRRHIYVVVYHHIHKNQFLSCAKIRIVRPRTAKSIFNAKGVTGEITFYQLSLFEPTWINFTVHSAKNELKENTAYLRRLAGFDVRTLPPDPTKLGGSDFCDTMGQIYNPLNIEERDLPPAGYGTQDQYPVGDLSGKLQSRNRDYPHNYLLPLTPNNELNGIYWDIFLPIKGSNSIINRGLAIGEYNRSVAQTTRSIWTCGTVSLYQENQHYQMQMITAQVHFRYPIVGRILFRQPINNSLDDTTIIIEYLIHADGSSVNTTDKHRWAIHAEPPGKDFYNWTGRCMSTGQIYNPFNVDFDPKQPAKSCSSENRAACPMGSLGNRFTTISIAGSKRFRSISRTLFTDQFLSLSGHNSILGKSLVIYDDFGPTARGERLGCSIIQLQASRKVVANDWFGNGVPISVKGKIEFTQQSEYEVTNIDVQLKGLMENSGYHVHVAPVQGELEFPCERSILYDHWNPQKVDPKSVPPPNEASTDFYEMGDLSGKFGKLDHLSGLMASYNDTNIPIFGYDTILGRSIVIHKKEKNIRWACSSLERGYSSRESREIRAIASFHHPFGFAYGYIRFTQLIHGDGSKSDTSIDVNLKYPGQNDRNKTRGHHWNIFVNPVGVDALVQQTLTRCVAGGYVWNPYYTQLADPLNTKLYNEECGPDNPLRCYVGDVSSRLGPIDIGMNRQIFSDKNIPLEGSQNAIGRSVVIFGPNQSPERFSCANIEPDHNIIKYVNLQRPPKFVVAQFLEEVRAVMGIPEWMLGIDSRKITILHNGGCIQMLIHFKGPLAHQMELDLSRLIASGRLDVPTLNIVGYSNQKRKKTLSYRTCGSRDPNDENDKKRRYGSRISNGCKSINFSFQSSYLFYIFIVYPLFIKFFFSNK